MTAPHAAGILFVSGERVLLIKRSASASVGAETWGIPGGSIEPGEAPEQAARRETMEEVGHDYTGPLRQLWRTPDGFVVFGADVPEFPVRLNHEHTAYQWARFDALPSPLFPGFGADLAHAGQATPRGARLALDSIRQVAAHCLRAR